MPNSRFIISLHLELTPNTYVRSSLQGVIVRKYRAEDSAFHVQGVLCGTRGQLSYLVLSLNDERRGGNWSFRRISLTSFRKMKLYYKPKIQAPTESRSRILALVVSEANMCKILHHAALRSSRSRLFLILVKFKMPRYDSTLCLTSGSVK